MDGKMNKNEFSAGHSNNQPERSKSKDYKDSPSQGEASSQDFKPSGFRDFLHRKRQDGNRVASPAPPVVAKVAATAPPVVATSSRNQQFVQLGQSDLNKYLGPLVISGPEDGLNVTAANPPNQDKPRLYRLGAPEHHDRFAPSPFHGNQQFYQQRRQYPSQEGAGTPRSQERFDGQDFFSGGGAHRYDNQYGYPCKASVYEIQSQPEGQEQLYCYSPSQATPQHQYSPGVPATPQHQYSPGVPATPQHQYSPGGQATPQHQYSPSGQATPQHQYSPGGQSTPQHQYSPGVPATPQHQYSPSPATPQHQYSPGGGSQVFHQPQFSPDTPAPQQYLLSPSPGGAAAQRQEEEYHQMGTRATDTQQSFSYVASTPGSVHYSTASPATPHHQLYGAEPPSTPQPIYSYQTSTSFGLASFDLMPPSEADCGGQDALAYLSRSAGASGDQSGGQQSPYHDTDGGISVKQVEASFETWTTPSNSPEKGEKSKTPRKEDQTPAKDNSAMDNETSQRGEKSDEQGRGATPASSKEKQKEGKKDGTKKKAKAAPKERKYSQLVCIWCYRVFYEMPQFMTHMHQHIGEEKDKKKKAARKEKAANKKKEK